MVSAQIMVNDRQGDSLSDGAIIAIVVGVVIVLPILIGVGLRLRDRRRGPSTDASPAAEPPRPGHSAAWGGDIPNLLESRPDWPVFAGIVLALLVVVVLAVLGIF